MYVTDATKDFVQLSHYNAEVAETFDWCPSADKLAISSMNSIHVFGDSLNAPMLTYKDIFEVEDFSGIQSS